ncbi:hypothetical protein UP09_05620 [Bradyrhizobium sp. LTSP885]|uniref:GntR family transcriptional regulator n=1 Tax=Bradyrhizobium sp. LTSP885 TaxID=1619232 RepID=UPI0005C8CFBF|nr:GntR family transcriptional regulator [Bradyrhizobium sp. LTSP885]KJC50478.1 hypothetical protein UP09_05620 [Bradyrhizobium sp. LTSP885]
MSSKVTRRPLFEQIYEVLWDRIISGEIAPGDRLQDIELAKRFKVSRTPAREAMRKLEQDGVLVPVGAGYMVRKTVPDDLTNLYACRAALEALAAEETAGRLPSATIDQLRRSIKTAEVQIDEGDYAGAAKEHTTFHAAILKYCGNEHLVRLLRSLQRLILFHRSSLLVQAQKGDETQAYADHLRNSQKFHSDILDALSTGNGSRASDLMQRHLRQTAEDMTAVVDAYEARVVSAPKRNAAATERRAAVAKRRLRTT